MDGWVEVLARHLLLWCRGAARTSVSDERMLQICGSSEFVTMMIRGKSSHVLSSRELGSYTFFSFSKARMIFVRFVIIFSFVVSLYSLPIARYTENSFYMLLIFLAITSAVFVSNDVIP